MFIRILTWARETERKGCNFALFFLFRSSTELRDKIDRLVPREDNEIGRHGMLENTIKKELSNLQVCPNGVEYSCIVTQLFASRPSGGIHFSSQKRRRHAKPLRPFPKTPTEIAQRRDGPRALSMHSFQTLQIDQLKILPSYLQKLIMRPPLEDPSLIKHVDHICLLNSA